MDLHRISQASVINTTLTGEEDCLLIASCNDAETGDSDPNCNGSELLLIRNSLFHGNTD